MKIGSVRYSHTRIGQIQTGASRGKAGDVLYLNPSLAVAAILARHGFKSVQIYSPLRVTFAYHRRLFDALLTQPLRTGTTGIWTIYAVVPAPSKRTPAVAGRIRHASQPRTQIGKIQAGADRRIVRYSLYLDPIWVVRHELPHLGFRGTVRIVPRLTVEVFQRLNAYDVTLIQPARRGTHGIWLVSNIEPHAGEVEATGS